MWKWIKNFHRTSSVKDMKRAGENFNENYASSLFPVRSVADSPKYCFIKRTNRSGIIGNLLQKKVQRSETLHFPAEVPTHLTSEIKQRCLKFCFWVGANYVENKRFHRYIRSSMNLHFAPTSTYSPRIVVTELSKILIL